MSPLVTWLVKITGVESARTPPQAAGSTPDKPGLWQTDLGGVEAAQLCAEGGGVTLSGLCGQSLRVWAPPGSEPRG
jgi:hypothetical protein